MEAERVVAEREMWVWTGQANQGLGRETSRACRNEKLSPALDVRPLIAMDILMKPFL